MNKTKRNVYINKIARIANTKSCIATINQFKHTLNSEFCLCVCLSLFCAQNQIKVNKCQCFLASFLLWANNFALSTFFIFQHPDWNTNFIYLDRNCISFYLSLSIFFSFFFSLLDWTTSSSTRLDDCQCNVTDSRKQQTRWTTR